MLLKKIFFLTPNIKLHFFKTFILPHFNYCSSILVYFSKTLLERLKVVYNSCLFNHLGIDLCNVSFEMQLAVLEPFNLFPFYGRLFFHLSLFYHKILHKKNLHSIMGDLVKLKNPARIVNTNIFLLPKRKSVKSSKSLSFFLPKFCNKVLGHAYNLELKDFKSFILSNFMVIYSKLKLHFL